MQNCAEVLGTGRRIRRTLTADKVALTGSLTVNNFESSLVADSLEITGDTLDIRLDTANPGRADGEPCNADFPEQCCQRMLTCNGSVEITAEGVSLAENKGVNGLYDFSPSWDGNSLKLESVLNAQTDLKDTGR